MLQQLFNAADTAIVGLFDTSSSLAAVGTNGKIIALIVALSSGLSVGVNVLVAQQIRQLYRCRKILRICLVFSIVSSLILIEPLVIFRNFFVGFFSADQTVIQNACLRILCILFFRTAVQPVRDPGRRIKRYRTFPVPSCCYYYWNLLFSHCMDLYGFQTLSSVKYSVLCVPDFMGVNDNPYYNRIHCKKAR